MYYVERKCQCAYSSNKGCAACYYTGWRLLIKTENRSKALAALRYWNRYYGGELKIRNRKG